MRRWALRILFCLIIGAITTVAVAWAFAYFVDLSTGAITEPRGIVLERPNQAWIGVAQRRFGSTLYVSYRNKAQPPYSMNGVVETGWLPQDVVPKWTGFYEEPKALSVSGCDLAVQMGDCRGWPLLALWSGPILDERTNGRWTIQPPSVGLDVGLPPTQMVYGHSAARLLPLRPIWRAFLIDTLFYAVIWFGVFFAPGMAKRAIRSKRGRCPRCSYDLRGDLEAGCPECGWNRRTD